jgi:hypothetical protein
MPVYLRLREPILGSAKIAIDETVVPVLDLAVVAPRRDTSGRSPATIGRGVAPIRLPSPTPTLLAAVPSTASSCSITNAASCNATAMRQDHRQGSPW